MRLVFHFTLLMNLLLFSANLSAKPQISLIQTANKELQVRSAANEPETPLQYATVSVSKVTYLKPKYNYKRKFLLGVQTSGFSGNLINLGQSNNAVRDLPFSAPLVLGLEVPFASFNNNLQNLYAIASTTYSSSRVELKYANDSKTEDTSITVYSVSAGLGYNYQLTERINLGAEYHLSAQRSVIPTAVSVLQSSSTNHFAHSNLVFNYKIYDTYNLQLAQVTTIGGQKNEIKPNSGLRILLRKEI